MCVAVCTIYPLMQFFNPSSMYCVANCPNGTFAEPLRQICIGTCAGSPSYYGYSLNNTCLLVCPSAFYADNSTRMCVMFCPQTTLQFADNTTNLCVSQCPQTPELYGELGADGYRRCVTTCSVGYFADPLTRVCLPRCNVTLGYYG